MKILLSVLAFVRGGHWKQEDVLHTNFVIFTGVQQLISWVCLSVCSEEADKRKIQILSTVIFYFVSTHLFLSSFLLILQAPESQAPHMNVAVSHNWVLLVCSAAAFYLCRFKHRGKSIKMCHFHQKLMLLSISKCVC